MEVVAQRGDSVYAVKDGEEYVPVNMTAGALGLRGPAESLSKWGYWHPFEGTPEQEKEILEAVRRLMESGQ